jgi:hypothetical protein
MKVLLTLLALISLLPGEVPKVRLLSVDDTSAIIRVAVDASPENLTSLMHTLTAAGVTSFILESHDQATLQKQKPAWSESGLQSITLRKPATRVMSDYPLLGPLEAFTTLRGIDDQFEREFEIFKVARKSLVTFLYQNGTPPANPDTTLQDLKSEISSLKSRLAGLVAADSEEGLRIASRVDLPNNPVTLSLEEHREALVHRKKLFATGIGHNHPEAKAIGKRVTAAKTLALKEVSTIEEALRVRLYQLERNVIWLEKYETLSRNEQVDLESRHLQRKTAYRNSLDKLRQMESAKDAALRSVPLPQDEEEPAPIE